MRLVATVGFALSVAVLGAMIWFLLSGRPLPRRARPGASARTEASRRATLAASCWLMAGTGIISATIATGWTASHPEATLRYAAPAWLLTFVLYLVLLARARRQGLK